MRFLNSEDHFPVNLFGKILKNDLKINNQQEQMVWVLFHSKPESILRDCVTFNSGIKVQTGISFYRPYCLLVYLTLLFTPESKT